MNPKGGSGQLTPGGATYRRTVRLWGVGTDSGSRASPRAYTWSPDLLCSPLLAAPAQGKEPAGMNSLVWEEKPQGREDSCLSFPSLHAGGWRGSRHPAANCLRIATCWTA